MATTPTLAFTALDEIPRIRDELLTTFKSGKTLKVQYRKAQLIHLAYLFKENEHLFVDALRKDLGRHELETSGLSIQSILGECVHAWENVEEWARPENGPLYSYKSWLGNPTTYKHPKGVGLIIGPFNYPLLCTITPLVGAIAAGCPCVVKMSDLTPATSGLLAELWPKYMDMGFTRIVNGAIQETAALLDLQWDHIVFTGSRAVAKIVANAAAKHLTPTTLEVGGPCPVFVDAKADLKVAARRILWAKIINAGQSCTAPNHVFVHADQQDELVKAFKRAWAEFYPKGVDQIKFPSHVVNDNHFTRLIDLMDPVEDDNIVCGGEVDQEARFHAPTIVKNVKLDDRLMKSEIFGPILPIVPVKDYQEAFDYTNASETPLALYIYSDDAALQDRIVNNTRSSTLVNNECILAIPILGRPSGGVSASGIRAHTGKFSFDIFTNERCSVYNPGWTDEILGWRYPPSSKIRAVTSQSRSIPIPRSAADDVDTGTDRDRWFKWTVSLGIAAIATVLIGRRHF
ncbi:hypothetical protein FRB93_005979 [Tulasnella sp. JGI-2019a]|nr:hypothetical protein FRB93_005979 [Tulasnella sp. JGI-2019a]